MSHECGRSSPWHPNMQSRIIGRRPCRPNQSHSSLAKAGRPHSPSVVKNLQDLDTALVHDEPFTLGFGSLATHKQCLELYLRAGPDPTVDFFAALQSLPEWLSEHAVAMPFVLIELNQRIGLLDVNGMSNRTTAK